MSSASRARLVRPLTLLTAPVTCALAITMLAACGDRLTEPTLSTHSPQLAKGNVDTNSRANLVWADSVLVNGIMTAAGIRGDGRLKNGSPATGTPSNEYQGNFCGPARVYNFYLSGADGPATAYSPRSFARGLDSLRVGQSATQWEGFGSPVAGCGRLVFDDQFPPASSPRQTRLPDVGTTSSGRAIRQWRIESQGSHRAACVNDKPNGTPIYTGVTYLLPFSLTVTEVPYPYPTYP